MPSTNLRFKIRELVFSQRSKIKNLKSISGFTLIEILVVLFVVAILGVILLTTSGTLAQRHSSNLQSIAAKIASKEIERLRGLDFLSLPSSGTITGDPDLTKLPSANAQRTVTNYQSAPEIKQVNVTVTWQVNEVNRQVSMETLIYQYGI